MTSGGMTSGWTTSGWRTSGWRTSVQVIALSIGVVGAIAFAMPASAQSLSGLDPVKVKTIPMGANEAAPVPPYPRTPAAVAPLKGPSPGLDFPATKVKTLRIDSKGHVVEETETDRRRGKDR